MLCAVLAMAGVASAAMAAVPCDARLVRALPHRPPAAEGGTEFARRVAAMSETERDLAIEAELEAGNIPSFLKRLAPVTLDGERDRGAAVSVTVCVMPDYLAIGSNRDFLRVPMRLATALTVAQRDGFTLPTSKIVDAVYAQSAVRLMPQPLPAGNEMRSTEYYRQHDQLIDAQQRAIGAPLGVLTAGDKKDLVLTDRLWRHPERVAIYGWHRAVDDPIQPLSTLHGARYADYSHGVRLVSTTVYVNGEPRSIFDVLGDPELAPMLSDEGPMPRLTELVASLAAPAMAAAASEGPLETGSPGAVAP